MGGMSVVKPGALAPRGTAFEHALSVDPRRVDQPVVAELKALSAVDVALLPEHADLDAFDASRGLLDVRSTADELRLPPPPLRSRSGPAMYRAVSEVVSRFARTAHRPVSVKPGALEAEARMVAVCRGIGRFCHDVEGARGRADDDIAVQIVARST